MDKSGETMADQDKNHVPKSDEPITSSEKLSEQPDSAPKDKPSRSLRASSSHKSPKVEDKPASSTSNIKNTETAATDIRQKAKPSNYSTIRYLNGDKLKRPLDYPKPVRRAALICMALGLVIGGIVLALYFDSVVNEPIRQQNELENVLSEDAVLNLPNLESLMPLDDEQITANLKDTGDTIFEKTPAGSEKAMELIKLPAGVSIVDAGSAYLSGIDSLPANQLIKLIHGSWDLKVDRVDGTSMVIHYCDFDSGNVDAALQAALVAEGFDKYPITDNGTDNSGNTFAEGNITTDTGDYTWRVSTIPLTEIYSTQGIPEDAVYVGIRMTS